MMQEQDTPKCVVPSTLDGWACLHEFYTVDWASWFDTDALERSDIIEASQSFLTQIAKPSKGHSGFFSMLGHKSDLMFLHFRETFDELN
ncbi:MAG: hypothetical protein KDD46_06570, partial [Bdellovibrionales bacterium]|nr:hypothetical protein [Bdellovibrionales bacterium]